MSDALLEQIVNAVLYEGYILYPYRPSSKKNQRERFTFGRVYPEAYSIAQGRAEPCLMQTVCLVRTSSAAPTLNVSVRFLHPLSREIGALLEPLTAWEGTEPQFRVVPELLVGTHRYQTWLEAVERRVDAPELALDSQRGNRVGVPFCFPQTRTLEPIYNGTQVPAVTLRRQAGLEGAVEIAVAPLSPSLLRITARIVNQTKLPEETTAAADAVLLRTFASTHTILQVQGAEFISLMDPGSAYKETAEACRNIGTWPVLVGDEENQDRSTMLSSPIILHDYPRIAPESAGPLFDGTEIDELLNLRIQTMTEEEKSEMRNVDEQARRLLERTERLPQERLLQMHGTIRKPSPPLEFDDFFGAHVPLKGVTVGGVFLKPGDPVRLRPRGRGDIMDIALNGQMATIEAIEEDLEHRIHLAVVLEADPGRDLGLMRQPGHRFFFGTDEVEPAVPNPEPLQSAGLR